MKNLFKNLGFFGFIVFCIMSCLSFVIFIYYFVPYALHNITNNIKYVYNKIFASYLVKIRSKYRPDKNFDIQDYSKPWGDSLD